MTLFMSLSMVCVSSIKIGNVSVQSASISLLLRDVMRAYARA